MAAAGAHRVGGRHGEAVAAGRCRRAREHAAAVQGQAGRQGARRLAERLGAGAARGVDRLAAKRLPAAVILCTNRLSAIDPAVQRRAADIFIFTRPNPEQRKAVLDVPLREAGLTSEQVDKIVDATGGKGLHSIGCTFSDLTQRLLPTLVLDAYPDQAITFESALAIAENLIPTPPFKDGQN